MTMTQRATGGGSSGAGGGKLKIKESIIKLPPLIGSSQGGGASTRPLRAGAGGMGVSVSSNANGVQASMQVHPAIMNSHNNNNNNNPHNTHHNNCISLSSLGRGNDIVHPRSPVSIVRRRSNTLSSNKGARGNGVSREGQITMPVISLGPTTKSPPVLTKPEHTLGGVVIQPKHHTTGQTHTHHRVSSPIRQPTRKSPVEDRIKSSPPPPTLRRLRSPLPSSPAERVGYRKIVLRKNQICITDKFKHSPSISEDRLSTLMGTKSTSLSSEGLRYHELSSGTLTSLSNSMLYTRQPSLESLSQSLPADLLKGETPTVKHYPVLTPPHSSSSTSSVGPRVAMIRPPPTATQVHTKSGPLGSGLPSLEIPTTLVSVGNVPVTSPPSTPRTPVSIKEEGPGVVVVRQPDSIRSIASNIDRSGRRIECINSATTCDTPSRQQHTARPPVTLSPTQYGARGATSSLAATAPVVLTVQAVSPRSGSTKRAPSVSPREEAVERVMRAILAVEREPPSGERESEVDRRSYSCHHHLSGVFEKMLGDMLTEKPQKADVWMKKWFQDYESATTVSHRSAEDTVASSSLHAAK